ncbi:hypothetical protein EPO15_08150 [bacterium]|nr:MAG: hypothetical protein EPO15_08150 [bacterium]
MRAALAALLFASFAQASPRAVHGAFSWEEPRGWASRDDWASAVPSYALTDGPALLSVTLYRPGNPLFSDLAAYRAHRLAGRGGGEKPRRADPAATRAGNAEVWELDYADASSPVHGAARPGVPMRERFALLARDGGFWVLSVKAPKARFEAAAQAFSLAVAGFRVLPDPGTPAKKRL